MKEIVLQGVYLCDIIVFGLLSILKINEKSTRTNIHSPLVADCMRFLKFEII